MKIGSKVVVLVDDNTVLSGHVCDMNDDGVNEAELVVASDDHELHQFIIQVPLFVPNEPTRSDKVQHVLKHVGEYESSDRACMIDDLLALMNDKQIDIVYTSLVTATPMNEVSYDINSVLVDFLDSHN